MVCFFVDQLVLDHHKFDCMFPWEVNVG